MYSSGLMINQRSEFWFFCKPWLLITKAFATCWNLDLESGTSKYVLFATFVDRFRKNTRNDKIYLPELSKTYNLNFLLQNSSGHFSVCLKPAPPNSKCYKIYGGFFFSCHKIWSIVCWLVHHYIGLFIRFWKVSRPLYRNHNFWVSPWNLFLECSFRVLTVCFKLTLPPRKTIIPSINRSEAP